MFGAEKVAIPYHLGDGDLVEEAWFAWYAAHDRMLKFARKLEARTRASVPADRFISSGHKPGAELPVSVDRAFTDAATQDIEPGLAITPSDGFEPISVRGYGKVVLLEPGQKPTSRPRIVAPPSSRPGAVAYVPSPVVACAERLAALPTWVFLMLGTIGGLGWLAGVWALWRISHGAW